MLNLLKTSYKPSHEIKAGIGVISGRQAADRLKISHHVFFAAIKAGDISPQLTIPREDTNEFGFDMDYINEVARIIPRKRGKGHTVFTVAVKGKLGGLNKQWEKRKIKFG